MVDTCVRVQISKNNECIFEKSSGKSKDNDIAGLLVNLKVMQQQVNDFLTTLVEIERIASDKDGSDCEAENEDSDEDDDQRVNPKKCKLTN